MTPGDKDIQPRQTGQLFCNKSNAKATFGFILWTKAYVKTNIVPVKRSKMQHVVVAEHDHGPRHGGRLQYTSFRQDETSMASKNATVG